MFLAIAQFLTCAMFVCAQSYENIPNTTLWVTGRTTVVQYGQRWTRWHNCYMLCPHTNPDSISHNLRADLGFVNIERMYLIRKVTIFNIPLK